MNTTTETNTETATQLVHKYNGLVVRAAAAGMTGYRELKVFHDKPTALARIAVLESALRARAEGERAEELRPPSNRSTARVISEPQENKVAKKVKTKKTKSLAPKVKIAAARAKANGHAVRAGSKTEIIRGLLTRRGGCTGQDVLDATGWTAVSMPAMARACGLALRKEKERGSVTQYFGE